MNEDIINLVFEKYYQRNSKKISLTGFNNLNKRYKF